MNKKTKIYEEEKIASDEAKADEKENQNKKTINTVKHKTTKELTIEEKEKYLTMDTKMYVKYVSTHKLKYTTELKKV